MSWYRAALVQAKTSIISTTTSKKYKDNRNSWMQMTDALTPIWLILILHQILSFFFFAHPILHIITSKQNNLQYRTHINTVLQCYIIVIRQADHDIIIICAIFTHIWERSISCPLTHPWQMRHLLPDTEHTEAFHRWAFTSWHLLAH